MNYIKLILELKARENKEKIFIELNCNGFLKFKFKF